MSIHSIKSAKGFNAAALFALCSLGGILVPGALAQSSMESGSSTVPSTNSPADSSKMDKSVKAGIPASKPTDAQIFKITQMVNDNEIAAAKMAQKQASNRDVKSFASEMEKEHGRLNQESAALSRKLKITPEESAFSAEVKNMGQTESEKLKMASRDTFDKTYMDSQTVEHEKVLAMLDTMLIPNANNPELKATLEAARKSVATHGEHAKRVQASLSKSAGKK